MKKYFKDWKVFALCFGMVVVSELIGSKPVKLGPVSFTLLPMLYALLLGIVLFKVKVIDQESMKTASPYITISVMEEARAQQRAAGVFGRFGAVGNRGAAPVPHL